MSSHENYTNAAETFENISILSCLGETSGALVDTETISDTKTMDPEVILTPRSDVTGTEDSSVLSSQSTDVNSGDGYRGYEGDNDDDDDDDDDDNGDSNLPSFEDSDNFISCLENSSSPQDLEEREVVEEQNLRRRFHRYELEAGVPEYLSPGKLDEGICTTPTIAMLQKSGVPWTPSLELKYLT